MFENLFTNQNSSCYGKAKYKIFDNFEVSLKVLFKGKDENCAVNQGNTTGT